MERPVGPVKTRSLDTVGGLQYQCPLKASCISTVDGARQVSEDVTVGPVVEGL